MANWKKVVISGSDISQLANDSGYVSASQLIASASVAARATTLSADATASYALLASDARTATSASIATLASTLSATATASHALTAVTASHALNVPATSSHALTAVSSSQAEEATLARSVAANSVALGTDTTGNFIATLGSGTGITIGSNTGEASSPTLAVNYGSDANTAVQGNTSLIVQGTAGEIEVTGGSITLGTGGTVTVGLPDNVTIAGVLTVDGNAVVDGDLIVGGRLVSASSLEVADQFIILASGSTSAIDGGIIINQSNAANGSGAALGYDSSADRWALQTTLAGNATALVPDAYMGVIEQAAGVPSAAPVYGAANGLGTLHVNSSNGDVYIYS